MGLVMPKLLKQKRTLLWLLLGSSCVAGIFMLVANLMVIHNRSAVYSNIDLLPKHDVGLLLGTSVKMPNGNQNWYCAYRIDAAVALYRAGKIKHILVSGDNHIASYDEPTDIQAVLLQRGIPACAITLDYAGFRTLDSIVRAKEVFGLHDFVIISQVDQDERALAIAHHNGIDAVAFCAVDVPFRYRIKTDIREIFARTKAVLDLYVLQTRPHFLGPTVKINFTS